MSQKTYPEDMFPVEIRPNSPFKDKSLNEAFDEIIYNIQKNWEDPNFAAAFDGNFNDILPLLHAVLIGQKNAEKNLKNKLIQLVHDQAIYALS